MVRKFKALGVALFAVMAMSAFVASAAQAIHIDAETYPATISGTGSEVGEAFNTEGGEVKCNVSHYTGTLTGLSSTLTVHPTYTECTAFGFLSATVATEECNYVFHATEHDEKTATYTAHVDVTCPAGQSIKINASTCKAEVKAQTGLTTVDITNMTGTAPEIDDLTVKPTLGKGKANGGNGKEGPVAYTVTQDGIGCPFSGTGAKTGGEYTTTGYITITSSTHRLTITT